MIEDFGQFFSPHDESISIKNHNLIRCCSNDFSAYRGIIEWFAHSSYLNYFRLLKWRKTPTKAGESQEAETETETELSTIATETILDEFLYWIMFLFLVSG